MMRSISECDLAEGGWDLAEWLERLTANAVVATVLDSISASSDTVESEGRQMKQCWISYIKKIPKKFPCIKNSYHVYFCALKQCNLKILQKITW